MNKGNHKIQTNRGMTYVELIVVLSIFSIMSSVVLFNYNEFQDRVDIKNLANDIALKIVEAQRTASGGLIPIPLKDINDPSSWKPTFGVYFNTSSDANKKSFIYYTDLDGSSDYTGSSCPSTGSSYECISKIDITKGNFISNISFFSSTDNTSTTVQDLSLKFTRPNSGASIYSGGSDKTQSPTNASYAEIIVSSTSDVTASIKVYASGRIQVN